MRKIITILLTCTVCALSAGASGISYRATTADTTGNAEKISKLTEKITKLKADLADYQQRLPTQYRVMPNDSAACSCPRPTAAIPACTECDR